MKTETLQEIQGIAKKDFEDVTASINLNQNDIRASVQNLKYFEKENMVTCTCVFNFTGTDDVIEASINYEDKADGIYADADIADVATAVLSAMHDTVVTPITAADDDEVAADDAFDFDAEESPDFGTDDSFDEELDAEGSEFIDEYEDPEEQPNIDTDNNIAGHYIVECNRCHGIFISALMESDQQVEFISGVCPLCEKESDQYIKWVVKPVEF